MNESKGSWRSGSAVPMKNRRSLVPVQKPAVPLQGKKWASLRVVVQWVSTRFAAQDSKEWLLSPSLHEPHHAVPFLLARKGLCPVLQETMLHPMAWYIWNMREDWLPATFCWRASLQASRPTSVWCWSFFHGCPRTGEKPTVQRCDNS